MSDAIRDGGPAFPSPGAFDGMSLRDWFAGQAISGALGKFLVAKTTVEYAYLVTAVEYAYLVADVMLEAREEAQP